MKKDLNKTLYFKVYTEIKKRIKNSFYEVGDLLPSEKSLQEEFQVSRATIRRALSELEKDYIVKKTNGVGTRVLKNKSFNNSFRLTGFNEDAIKDGQQPASIVVKFTHLTANEIVADSLNISEGDEVYYLERIRLLDGMVSGINKTYISKELGFKIDMNKWTPETSLYEFYSNNNVEVKYGEEIIEAILPDDDLSAKLYIDKNEPIFYRQRITFDNNSIPIEYSQNYYIAKGHKYFVKLEKDK